MLIIFESYQCLGPNIFEIYVAGVNVSPYTQMIENVNPKKEVDVVHCKYFCICTVQGTNILKWGIASKKVKAVQ